MSWAAELYIRADLEVTRIHVSAAASVNVHPTQKEMVTVSAGVVLAASCTIAPMTRMVEMPMPMANARIIHSR